MKRLLSILLSIALVLSILPLNIVSVSAEGNESSYTQITALPSGSGYYKLTQNITDTAAKSYNSAVSITIDLNGYSITPKDGNRIFRLSNGAKLTIIDSSAGKTGRLHPAKNNAPKGGIVGMFSDTGDTAFPELYLKNVTIDGLNRTVNGTGGAIDAEAGTFTMEGGAIINCVSQNGGAIYEGVTGTKVELTDVKITDNSATENGGAIYVANGNLVLKGNTTIEGNGRATVEKNKAKKGGAIYVANSGIVTIDNAAICKNEATNTGGGVFLDGAAKLSMINGSKITGNKSNAAGGGIRANTNTSTVEITGGTLSENTAGTSGGAIFSNGRLTIKNATISQNTANGDFGGGIQAQGSTTIENTKIINNKAPKGKGGGIYAVANVTLKDCTVCDNTAKVSGGGIDVHSANLTLKLSGKTVITGNKAGDVTSNFNLIAGSKLTLDTLTTGAAIGITVADAAKDRILAENVTGDVSQYFTDDTGTFGIGTVEGKLVLGAKSAGISLSMTSCTLGVDDTKVLTVTFVPEDAVNKSVQWSSNKTSVATVNADGKITAVSVGTAIITATSVADKSITAKCEVNVIEKHLHDDYACDCAEGEKWQIWTSTTTLPTTSGYYYLYDNITLTSNMTVLENANIVLCLNGKTVTGKSDGRIYKLNGNASLTICDCTATTTDGVYAAGKLVGGSAQGGCIWANAGNNVTIYDGILTGATNSAIFAWSSNMAAVTTVTLKGGILTGNSALTGAAVCLNENNPYTVFKMKGGEISGNTATKNGGAIAGKGTIELTGGKISNNTATGNGGAIYAKGAQLTASGVTFSGNKANTSGGAFYTDGATVTLDNCKLSDNRAEKQAGAIYASGGTFTVKNSTVSGNSSGTQIAAIYGCAKTKLTLDGATVTGNTCGTAGYGAVSIPNSGSTLVLRGKVVIKDNVTAAGAKQNLVVYGNQGVTVGVEELNLASEIHFTYKTWQAGKILSENAGTGDVSACFVGDKNGYVVVKESDKLVLAYDQSLKHVHDCGAEKNINWTPWLENDSLPKTSGYYVLTENVELKTAQAYTAGVDIHICLNGFTVKQTGTNVRLLRISDGAKVTICDCTGEGKLTGGNLPDDANIGSGGAIYVAGKGSSFTLLSGNITENKAGRHGGAIVCINEAELYIEGGRISNNTAGGNAGAIFVSDGKLHLNGGEISGNTAGGTTGAVYVSASTVDADMGKMTGGKIANNTAKSDCAGLYLSGGTFTLSGGAIDGNTAEGSAGGVNVRGAATFVMTGGSVSNNTAKNGAGVVVTKESTFKLSGGKVSGNSATNNGGGVYIVKGSTLEMTGGEISGNNSANFGGGVFLGGDGTFKGGKIANNTSKNEGAGVYVGGENTMTLSGTAITGNQSSGAAGGVNVRGAATFVMTGGSVSNNTAQKSGAGIVVTKDSHLVLSGGTISGNNAVTGSGGGIFINTGCDIVMSGGTVSGNNAASNGGGIYLGGDGTLKGGSVKENTAVNEGGGIYIAGGNTATLNGTNITDNVAANGAGVLARGKAEVTFASGEISGNEATSHGGGFLIQSYATLNMTGGRIMNNTAGNTGGGIRTTDNTISITGGEISGNVAGGQGGGIYTQGVDSLIRGVRFENNKAEATSSSYKSIGGALLLGVKSAVTVEDCIFTGNEAVGSGAAIGVWHTENSVVKHCEFTDNAAHSFGGAIYVSANAHIPFTECTIHDNTASTRGGAIYVDASGLLQSNGNRMENNTAANGGAVYIAESGSATMTDDTIMGNKAKIGSAIYSSGVLEMCGVQITGNKATDHTAVYLDGTSNDALTMNATCKFGGDLVIRDNDGGDAYVTNDGIIFVNTDGLGTNAHIALQLESGIISNMVFGTYDYEKLTECNYLLTAGTRSITDPESGMIQTDGMSNIWLYVAIGVCAVLVILILVIVLLKRRKQKKEN